MKDKAIALIMDSQNVIGNIIVDSVSTINMTMKTNSYFEGIINADKTAKSITLKLDENSKIKLTGNSYITDLEDEDGTYGNIDLMVKIIC